MIPPSPSSSSLPSDSSNFKLLLKKNQYKNNSPENKIKPHQKETKQNENIKVTKYTTHTHTKRKKQTKKQWNHIIYCSTTSECEDCKSD